MPKTQDVSSRIPYFALVIVAERPLTTAPTWIDCQGWFSDWAHSEPVWIGIADGKIAGMSGVSPGAGRMPLDDASLYAVPLLSDSHVHVYMEPWPVAPSQRRPPGSDLLDVEVSRALARVDKALRAGVGLLRDMGDPHGINQEVKRRLASSGVPAPELLICGPGFHRPRKYGRLLGVARETVAEIRASITELHRLRQVDYIKLVTTGIVDFAERCVKQSPQFSVAELSEIVSHAHALGYKVASHCSGQDGIDINLAAGVDFIEHAYFVREDQIDRMIEQEVVWTPTLAPVHVQGQHPDSNWPPEVRRTIESILEEHAARIQYGIGRGARVLVGTDAGSPGVEMGSGLRIELQRLATAGIPADRLLQMATTGNARSLGATHYAARLEIGAPASFALYAQCPWRDIRNLDTLRHVFCAGQRVL